MKSDIKILLIGDEGVGKTTIISTFVSCSFVEQVQKIVPEVTIPAEVLNAPCATRIIDTCITDENQSKTQLNIELKRCDAIIIVYACNRFDSFMSVRSKWIPLIKSIRQTNPVPIVIVGNKSDLQEDNSNKTQIEETIHLISQDYSESIRWMECSAKSMTNIHDLLDKTQELVLFPEKVLFDSANNRLTEKCEKVLRRIFHICDLDNDGALNDQEINYFQQRCQNVTMTEEEIARLKEFLQSRISNGVNESGFTIDGFLFMNLLFLYKSAQNTWTSIRAFKYNDQLELSNEYLNPKINIPFHSHVELNTDGIDYIKSLFSRFDSDSNGILSPKDQELLYLTTPSNPFTKKQYEMVGSSNGNLTLNQFLSLWSLQTYQDYTVSLKYFAYFGYESILKPNTTDLIQIVQNENDNIKRTSFVVYVFGSNGCGKTSLLNHFSLQPVDVNVYQSKGQEKIVCSSVSLYKYLILNEFNGNEAIQSKELMSKCDALLLIYDDSSKSSFDTLSTTYQSLVNSLYTKKYPVFIIKSTKSSNSSNNNTNNEITTFFTKNGLQPIEFTVDGKRSIYQTIVDKIDKFVSSTSSSNNSSSSSSSTLIAMGALGAILAAGSFFAMKLLKKN